jgi:hypothetical protein
VAAFPDRENPLQYAKAAKIAKFAPLWFWRPYPAERIRRPFPHRTESRLAEPSEKTGG